MKNCLCSDLIVEVESEENISQIMETFHLRHATKELSGEGVVSRVEGAY